MKFSILAIYTFPALIALPLSLAEELSEEQTKSILERIEILEKEASADAQGRYATAYQACKKAMGSSQAATEFYIKCYGKLEFEDKGKSDKEFRDWKRRNKDRLSEDHMQRALQHQLSWLVLTLEVERSDKESWEFAPEALDRLRAIQKDMPLIAGSEKVLATEVTQSVFAKCYKVNQLTKDGWPSKPTNFKGIFDDLLLPKLAEKKDYRGVRKMWDFRIALEKSAASVWGGGRFEKGREFEEQHDLRLEKFMEKRYPNLVWSREMEVYRAGGEADAVASMLDLIENQRANVDREKWIEQLKQLLENKASTAPVKEDDSPFIEPEEPEDEPTTPVQPRKSDEKDPDNAFPNLE